MKIIIQSVPVLPHVSELFFFFCHECLESQKRQKIKIGLYWKFVERSALPCFYDFGNKAYNPVLSNHELSVPGNSILRQDPITRENELAWQFIMMMEFFFVFAPICTTTENYLIEIAIYLFIVASYSSSNVSVRLY